MARGQGKTTAMLIWLTVTENSVMITHSYQEAERLKELRPDLADRIYSAYSVLEGRLRGQHVTVGIDNLDMILPYFVGQRVGPVTSTEG